MTWSTASYLLGVLTLPGLAVAAIAAVAIAEPVLVWRQRRRVLRLIRDPHATWGPSGLRVRDGRVMSPEADLELRLMMKRRDG